MFERRQAARNDAPPVQRSDSVHVSNATAHVSPHRSVDKFRQVSLGSFLTKFPPGLSKQVGYPQGIWVKSGLKKKIFREKVTYPKNHWTLRIWGYGMVWMCIARVWRLQTTSFEISWFLGSPVRSVRSVSKDGGWKFSGSNWRNL